MNIFNRKTCIALNILQTLSGLDNQVKCISADALAQILSESEDFCFQILRDLRMLGYVESTRGPGGGYKLSQGVTRRSLHRFLSDMGTSFEPKTSLNSERASEKVQLEFAFMAKGRTLGESFSGRV